MTRLSVNVNKVALLRNTRTIGIPSVTRAAQICIDAGAYGITVHPRPDQRHIRPSDVYELNAPRHGSGVQYRGESLRDRIPGHRAKRKAHAMHAGPGYAGRVYFRSWLGPHERRRPPEADHSGIEVDRKPRKPVYGLRFG